MVRNANGASRQTFFPMRSCPSLDRLCPIARRMIVAGHSGRRDELAEKARQGTLSEQEAAELRNYSQIGRILELLKPKAKVSLSKTTPASQRCSVDDGLLMSNYD